MGGIIERQKEIRRRRKRRQKFQVLKRKLKKASASEKVVIAAKVRKMTVGAEDALSALGLAETK